jgi:hypothetical protein
MAESTFCKVDVVVGSEEFFKAAQVFFACGCW